MRTDAICPGSGSGPGRGPDCGRGGQRRLGSRRRPKLAEERAAPRTGGRGRASCTLRSLCGWAARRRAGAAVARETERGQWEARSPAEPGCCGSSPARVGGEWLPGGAEGRRVLGQREVAVALRGEGGEFGTPLVAAQALRRGAAREWHLFRLRVRQSQPSRAD